jgi:hypothetical protein
MPINFKCPHCQTLLQVGSDLGGVTGICWKCKKGITVPDETETQNEEKETAKKE